ncbi:MAG: hypothetical protein HYW51_00365 [Candidatus Doudnabacteria bacterium]|nr:hypothetical protein [Candidatus Doudnabacteria bacterium]
MKKRTEHNLKAEKREIKKRPRMRLSGASLKRPSKFSGMALVKIKNQRSKIKM